EKLQRVFDEKLYDPANEPDIAYPYLFSYFRGEEWRTQKEVKRLIDTHYKATPDGIPGNDDCGTMSAWLVFSMIGLYPDCPGEPSYTLTSPVFDKITLHLDKRFYPNGDLTIETIRKNADDYLIKEMKLGEKQLKKYRISHKELINAGKLSFKLMGF
ncbi:MAG: glycoside hydrolase family 92 protein, partial [Prevotella sp.]|nr:glycoside hydrolase family 92 protein [Prevotella sp.]